MSRANKRWLIVGGLGFLVAVMVGRNSYIRSRDEAVVHKLIAEFHHRYNSSEHDDATEYGPMIIEVVLRERSQLGSFLQLKHCTLAKSAEPPWHEAKCLSTFQKGEVEEFFIIPHVPNDPYLLLYSAESGGQRFSIR
jgi:hypothetical protein